MDEYGVVSARVLFLSLSSLTEMGLAEEGKLDRPACHRPFFP